uniref:Short-chain dehydrogenase/reductase n=1 Tax=Waltergamsia fusidioides TaxID=749674 RepID=A0A411G467_9HYPO|nr:short-chain dehydrogenase/reductase [Waltergamsia fusidioides]
MSLKEVAIVTGGAAGVGLAAAKILAKRGYIVVVSDVAVEQGHEAVAAINQEFGQGTAIFIACDLGKTEEIDQLLASVVAQFSRFSVLVNNAGYLRAPFLAISAEQVEQTIAVNLTAPIYATQQAIKIWNDDNQGGNGDGEGAKGNVVNITSSSSFKTHASIAAYGAAKAGAAQFTFACRSFGPSIRVNAVAPTAIATAFDKNASFRVPTDKTGPGYTPEEDMRNMGLARLQPEQVAEAAFECIDDETRFGTVAWLDATEGQKIHTSFAG